METGKIYRTNLLECNRQKGPFEDKISKEKASPTLLGILGAVGGFGVMCAGALITDA